MQRLERHPRNESGATLIVAMIILLVLTLLGVTALTTTGLEEKMAANTQERNRAFQAAESGLSAAFADPNAYNLSATPTTGATKLLPAGTYSGHTNAGASYTTRYVGASAPPVGSLWSASSFNAYHFDTQSTAANSNTVEDPANIGKVQAIDPANVQFDKAAIVLLVGGAYQMGPKF